MRNQVLRKIPDRDVWRTSMPMMTTVLILYCCSTDKTSGVAIENIVLSNVPRCKGPMPSRSTSDTVSPNAANKTMKMLADYEPMVHTSSVLCCYGHGNANDLDINR